MFCCGFFFKSAFQNCSLVQISMEYNKTISSLFLYDTSFKRTWKEWGENYASSLTCSFWRCKEREYSCVLGWHAQLLVVGGSGVAVLLGAAGVAFVRRGQSHPVPSGGGAPGATEDIPYSQVRWPQWRNGKEYEEGGASERNLCVLATTHHHLIPLHHLG